MSSAGRGQGSVWTHSFTDSVGWTAREASWSRWIQLMLCCLVAAAYPPHLWYFRVFALSGVSERSCSGTAGVATLH